MPRLLAASICLFAAAPALQASSTEDLLSLSLEELGKVTVTSVTKEPEQVWRTPAAIHVLTAADIERSGATSIPEALRLAPGVQVSRIEASQWAVAVRGLAGQLSQSLLVLVNGRNTYTPLFAGVYWDVLDLPLEGIERIEIIRGPGGTIWGTNAFSGVINIITRSAAETQGALVSLLAGDLDERIASARYGGARGDFAYRFIAKTAWRDGSGQTGPRDFDEWNFSQVGFRGDWKRSDDETVRLEARLYDGEIGRLVDIGVYAPPAQLRIQDLQQLQGGHLSAQYRRQLGSGSDLQASIYYDHTDRRGRQYGERRDTVDFDLLHSFALSRQLIRWGFGVRWSPSDFREVVPTVEFLPPEQTDRVLSVFVQDEITLGAELRLALGAKLEKNRYTDWEAQPSARLIWNPSERRALWAAVSRAVRIPSRLERDLRLTGNIAPTPPLFLRISGSDTFDAEELIAWEAGFRQLFGERLFVDLAAFRNEYTDLIGFRAPRTLVETSPPPQRTVLDYEYANAQRGRGWGVEIAPTWVASPWLEFRGGYSYLDLELEPEPGFGEPNLSNARVREGSSPAHQGFLQITARLPREVDLTATLRAVSELPGQGVPAFETLDLQASWAVSDQLSLAVVGQNLLDNEHPEFGGTPGLVGIPRSVYAKLVWRSR